jgi:hypothetical protein
MVNINDLDKIIKEVWQGQLNEQLMQAHVLVNLSDGKPIEGKVREIKSMTVGQLIAELQKYDPDAYIYVQDGDYGLEDIAVYKDENYIPTSNDKQECIWIGVAW